MSTAGILRIERLNYLFGGIAIIVAALVATRAQALGLTIGVVITSLNFFFLRKVVFRWTAAVKAGDDKAGANRILLILPKMIGLMGAVAVAILFLPIDAIGFLIGYSVFIVSIVVGTVIDVIVSPSVDPTPVDPTPVGPTTSDDKTSSHG